MEYFIRIHIITLTLISLFSSHAVLASSNDDYLKLLETEAADTSVDQGESVQQVVEPGNNLSAIPSGGMVEENWYGECDYATVVMPSDLAEEEFSSYLKQCAMGTHMFYSELNFRLKRLVYKNYQSSVPMRLKTLRKNILSYF